MTRYLTSPANSGGLALALVASTVAFPVEVRAEGEALPDPVIELYTMGQGELLAERFGHAALCVCYPDEPDGGCLPKTKEPRRGARKRSDSRPPDRCYNYGVTDFSAPLSLGWGFLRGRAEFWVETWDPTRMVRIYERKDRTLWRQRLDLRAEQRREIARRLEHDSRPENRYYKYHHFYENCTTRLRDIINDATGGKLKEGTESKPGPSFRDYSRQGFAEFTSVLLITDLIMGRKGDIQPDRWQLMFLPDYLREEVAEKLGAEPVLIYERRGRPFAQEGPSGRGWVVLLGLLIGIPVLVTRLLRRRERLGLIPAALVLGLLGLIVWFMAAVSTLAELRYNEVMLVFVPTDIALPFLGARRRMRYAQVRVALLMVVSILRAVGLFLQPLWILVLCVFMPLLPTALPDEMIGAFGTRSAKTAGGGAEKDDPRSERKNLDAQRPRKNKRKKR